jgi:hypothetical protein
MTAVTARTAGRCSAGTLQQQQQRVALGRGQLHPPRALVLLLLLLLLLLLVVAAPLWATSCTWPSSTRRTGTTRSTLAATVSLAAAATGAPDCGCMRAGSCLHTSWLLLAHTTDSMLLVCCAVAACRLQPCSWWTCRCLPLRGAALTRPPVLAGRTRQPGRACCSTASACRSSRGAWRTRRRPRPCSRLRWTPA